MSVHNEKYSLLKQELDTKQVTLVAVSKIQPVEAILKLYESGQLDFGENYVRELVDKQAALPKDIRWHFIGHLQSNKAKYIAPFVHLIHGVDSFKLLKAINKEAAKNNRVIDVLLQVHIAQEETKFGLNEEELNLIIQEFDHDSNGEKMTNVRVCGFMGMASFSDDLEKVRGEFRYLKTLLDKYSSLSIANCQLSVISMGMSGDYKIAIEEGSTMVRIGSLLFGTRN